MKKLNSVARNHHYLPQAYLAAFTDTGLKNGQFNVLDVKTEKVFKTRPSNVAVERDFNRLDIQGYPSDVLENSLCEFEGQVTQAIQNVIRAKSFPNDSDLNLILNFLGLIYIRNPKQRKSFNHSRELSIQMTGNLLVADKTIWNYHFEKARDAGVLIDENISYEKMKDFVDNKKYRIEVLPEENSRMEFDVFDKVLPILGQRTWSLLIAPDDGPEFICADHPVTVVWKKGKAGPIGLALKQTEIFFPLSRRTCFYGVFEDVLENVVVCKPGNVATINKHVFLNAGRQVYTSLEKIAIWANKKIKEIPINR